MLSGPLILPGPAAALQIRVQRLEGGRLRGRGHEVGSGVLDQPLDLALVVAPAGTSEAISEQVVANQLGEGTGTFALASAADLGHRDPGVVVENRQRHAGEEIEGGDVPVEERLGGLPRIRLHEAGVGMRQVHAEEVDLPAHAADGGDRFAEVDLRVAGWVRQRHEGLPPARACDPDVVLHHRVAAAIAVLVAQTLENPLGRVTLLDGCDPVRLQDRIDHRQQRPQLRLLDRLRARVARRQREPAHLGNRLAIEPKYPGCLTTRVAVDENKLPNGRVDFHGKHPGPLPKEKPLKLADFYAARISTPPTLQWMVLSPPYTTLRESSDRVSALW